MGQLRWANIALADSEAEELLRQQSLDSDAAFPLDVESLAKNLGINIIYAPLSEIQGWAEDVDPDLDGFFYRPMNVMMVRDDRSESRRRFTIAHEIGHFRLHPHLETDYVKRSSMSSKAIDVDEMEANRFAASLLMPKSQMKPLLEKKSTVSDIAQRFKVSPAAAFNRADALLREFKLPYYLNKA